MCSSIYIINAIIFCTHSLKIFEHSLSATEYKLFYHRTAEFGPQPNTYNISGRLQLLHPIDGCDISEYVDSDNQYRQVYDQQIVMILRGNCTFSDKVYNCQVLGAIGAIIGDYNSSNGQEWVVMSKDDTNSIHIPSVFVPHNTFQWIYNLITMDTSSDDGTFAVIDSDGEYAEQTSTFWLAAFGIVIIVIPTLWCFIVCIALLRKRIVYVLYTVTNAQIFIRISINRNYAKKSKRKQHLTQIPVILYKAECDGIVSPIPESKERDANDLCAKLVNDGNDIEEEQKMDACVTQLSESSAGSSMFGSMTKKLLDSFVAKKKCYHPHNDSCAICLDDFRENEELRLLPCHHAFHRHCVDPWLLKQSELCPMCKQSIFDYDDDDDGGKKENEDANGCIAKLLKVCCSSRGRQRQSLRENLQNIEENLNENVDDRNNESILIDADDDNVQ